ncbi:MAG: EamA family transporter [Deinococcota bacterium]|nr:EamA family transporter [Allomeiothermus silvanus]
MNLSPTGLLHLLVVYIVWSSTYLAFRVGVGPGGGWEPFLMGAARFIPAALILLGYAYARRQRLWLSREEFATLSFTGVMMWVGGNGLILIAAQYAPSNYQALMIAASPIWANAFEALLDRKRPAPLLIYGLLIGLVGIGVLSVPKLAQPTPTSLLSFFLLLVSPICWSAGSVITQRRPFVLDAVVVSGYQQLFGGIGFLLIAPLLGEHGSSPSLAGWGALVYLIAAGSLLAYTSYILAVRLLPLSIVMTYAYVNPVLTAFLGWLLLGEQLTGWTLAGAALVLIGVAGVFQSRAKR